MPEYIDREKVLKILENSLNFSKTELNTAHKQFQKGCVSAIEDDIGNISHMPTEDVVPRSEVEKAKQDVLREVFEKLGVYISQEVTIDLKEEAERKLREVGE